MNRRILIVGAQHGDERLGPRLQRYIAAQPERFASVDYLCGNPRAYRANIRFIDSDLNRSYASAAPTTYEEKRAQKILRKIRGGLYDYVLDVHTSTADVDRFFITTHLDGAAADIIGSSNFKRVVVMPPDIAECSLIGQIPRGISIEYDHNVARQPQALLELGRLLDNLLAENQRPMQREVFYVRETIAVDNDLTLAHRNFTRTEQGFYPILFGERTYTQHRGFAAYKRAEMHI